MKSTPRTFILFFDLILNERDFFFFPQLDLVKVKCEAEKIFLVKYKREMKLEENTVSVNESQLN